jgi:hypothetical protein
VAPEPAGSEDEDLEVDGLGLGGQTIQPTT